MGLREKLTLAFALVAFAAVGVTSALTLAAARNAQDRLAGLMLEHMRAAPMTGNGMGAMGESARPAMEAMLGGSARDVIAGLQTTALVSALTAGALAILAAALIARRLTAPLGALADGAARLEAGERGLRLPPVGRDELGRVTEAFNRLVTGLERQETLRRELIADIAHDLRTPIAVVRSKLEAMQDGLIPADPARLGALHQEMSLLGRLVEDLRTLSLAEGGGLDLRLEVVRLRPVLERAVEGLTSRAAQVGVQLRLEPTAPDLEARLDPDRFEQVLHNLLDNAIRHAGPGRVELGARGEAGGTLVFVRDHGPGLPPEALERAFERFYRADPSRSRATGGSGLGLAIARAIVEAHGGRLEASNHPQGGAVFTLHLPTDPG